MNILTQNYWNQWHLAGLIRHHIRELKWLRAKSESVLRLVLRFNDWEFSWAYSVRRSFSYIWKTEIIIKSLFQMISFINVWRFSKLSLINLIGVRLLFVRYDYIINHMDFLRRMINAWKTKWFIMFDKMVIILTT